MSASGLALRVCCIAALSVGALARNAGEVGARSSCGRPLQQIEQSRDGRIVMVRVVKRRRDEFWYACWRPTGRRRYLGTARELPGGGLEVIGAFNFRGPWLVWSRTTEAAGGRDAMHSLDVRTGKRGPTVNVPAQHELTDTNGPVAEPECDDCGFVAINARGEYAWIVRDSREDALYAPDGNGGSVLIDHAETGAIDVLDLRGRTMIWHVDGARRSARLPSGSG